MDYQTLTRVFSVPRETYQKLVAFDALLRKWQCSINLVSPSSLDTLWERHIIDSLQLLSYIKEESHLLDIGSGAGFPGIVFAIAGKLSVSLVESDMRKCAFLSEALRVTETTATIYNQRIETLSKPELKFDVVTARGCANLDTLLHFSFPFLHPESICIFPKGKNWDRELEEARHHYIYDVSLHDSLTDPQAKIIIFKNIKRL